MPFLINSVHFFTGIIHMPAYKAPLRDIRFLMNEVLDYPSHFQTLSNGANADADTVDMILEGAADLCEKLPLPLSAPRPSPIFRCCNA